MSPATLAFWAVMAFWLAVPIVQRDQLAQDALPFVVAGELVSEDPAQVYAPEAADLYDLPPAFADRSCALAPPGTDCDRLVVAYVASPGALPLSWLLARAGPEVGIWALRLLAAGSLVAGMALLRARVLRIDPGADLTVAVSALLLTPFALLPIVLGQTTPLLFLSAVLGPVAARPAGVVGRSVLWATTIVAKGFPAVLGLLAIALRRFALLALTLGLVILVNAVALVAFSPELVSTFLEAANTMSGHAMTNPYNRAPVAVLAGGAGTWLAPAGALAGLAVASCLWAWRVRRSTVSYQWAWGWLASLLVVPLVWWHYLWLAVPVVALAAATAARGDRRARLVLPGFAVLTVVLTALDGPGTFGAFGAGALLVVAVVAGAVWSPQVRDAVDQI